MAFTTVDRDQIRGGVALAMKLTDVCHRLCQCRPELNVIVRVRRHALRPAFPVPLPGKEEHWRSGTPHTDQLASATQPTITGR